MYEQPMMGSLLPSDKSEEAIGAGSSQATRRSRHQAETSSAIAPVTPSHKNAKTAGAASAPAKRRKSQRQETTPSSGRAQQRPSTSITLLAAAWAKAELEGRTQTPFDPPEGRTGPAIPRTPERSWREVSSPARRRATGATIAQTVDYAQASPSSSARPHPDLAALPVDLFDVSNLQAFITLTSEQRRPNPNVLDPQSNLRRRQLIANLWPATLPNREQRGDNTRESNLPSSEIVQHLAGVTPHGPSARPSSSEFSGPLQAGDSSNSGGGTQYHSVAASGHQFFPPATGDQVLLPGHSQPRSRRTCSPTGKIGIGIETEFLLAARQFGHRRREFHRFADVVASNHNADVAPEHPRMTNDVKEFGGRTRFDHWALVADSSVSTGSSPWGIEMISPILVAFPGSRWRSHVEATWEYLQRAYEITGSPNCGTHIHVSVEGGYSLNEIKRVAQAVIHFEPAFDALVPPHRRVDSDWAQSSWLESREFATKGLSRAQSIALIGRVTDIFSLMSLMQPLTWEYYTFNLQSILKYYTIEFRKPPTSTTVEEALGWAELAMNFIQASLKDGYPHLLNKVPPTVGGLRWFLSQSQVAGLNEPHRLRYLFDGKDKNTYVQGKVDELTYKGFLSPVQKNLDAMIHADTARIEALINHSREPYW